MYSAVETASSRKASERERIWFYPPTLISYAVLAVMIVLLAYIYLKKTMQLLQISFQEVAREIE